MTGVSYSQRGAPGPITPGPVNKISGRPVAKRLQLLATAVEGTRRRQRTDIRKVMLVVGALAMGLGIVSVVLGWYGASHSTYLFQQIPYVISGGILGASLVAGGGFLFFAAWLVRMMDEGRRQSARLLDVLSSIDASLRDEHAGLARRGDQSATNDEAGLDSGVTR
jgi:hypothetical protein